MSRSRSGRLAGVLALAAAAACATRPSRPPVGLRTGLARGVDEAAAGRDPGPAELGADSSLDDYVRHALLHDPGIQAAYEEWRAALARIDQQDALPDPRLTWAHFVEPIETRTGPQRNRLSVAQTLPWFGKLSGRGEVAARHAEAVWWKVEARRVAVVRAVQAAWYDYAFLARDLRITADNLELLRGLEPVVQRRVQGGAAQAGLLQLQVEIGKVEDQHARLESYRPAVSARLAALMNRRDPEPLPWPELGEPDRAALDPEAARAQLLSANPELLELEQAIEREAARVEVADLEGLPDLTFGVDWFETGDARMPGVTDSGEDPWAVSVSMNLPIGRAKYRAMVDEAERQKAAIARRFDQRANELHVDLRMALYRHDDAARQVGLYRDTLLPRARQALAVTRSAYAQAAASLLDVIDRQRTLLSFEQSYWRACAELGKSRAEIEALTGAWVARRAAEGAEQR
jgi:outer membrane protein TolC